MNLALPMSRQREASYARDAALDIARGIAMVLVVFGHALDGAQSAGHSSYALRFTMIAVYAVHVPLFFQVSGILSQTMCEKPWTPFLADLWRKIVWPYLLWAFVLLTLHYALGNHTNATLQHYQPLSILWRAPAVLWFLYVLCIGLVLLRLLAPLPWHVTLLVGVLFLLLPYAMPEWPQKTRFIGMFLISAAAGPTALRLALNPIFLLLAAAVMSLTLWHIATVASVPIIGYPSYQAVFIPAIFAGPILLYAASHLLDRTSPAALIALIGRNTMAIFVTHILVTAAVRIALLRLGVSEWSLIILLATIAGILLPLAAALLAKRLSFSRALGWA